MVNDEFADGPLTGSRGRLDSIVGVLSRQLSCQVIALPEQRRHPVGLMEILSTVHHSTFSTRSN